MNIFVNYKDNGLNLICDNKVRDIDDVKHISVISYNDIMEIEHGSYKEKLYIATEDIGSLNVKLSSPIEPPNFYKLMDINIYMRSNTSTISGYHYKGYIIDINSVGLFKEIDFVSSPNLFIILLEPEKNTTDKMIIFPMSNIKYANSKVVE